MEGFRLEQTQEGVVLTGEPEAGTSLRGIRADEITILDSLPGVNALLPRPFKRRRGRPVYRQVDFSGLATNSLNIYAVVFIECLFLEVHVRTPLPTQAHFIDCRFSGEWDGVFWSETMALDPAPKTIITGNDFRGLRGTRFIGGVELDGNRFSHGADQFILHTGSAHWREVVSLAKHDEFLARQVSSLQGLGPIGYQQDWCVMDKEYLTPRVWAELVEIAKR